MPERQYDDAVFRTVIPIKRDIAGVAERDNEFPHLSRIGERSPDFRMIFQPLELIRDRPSRPLGRPLVSVGQESSTSVHSSRRASRDDQSWHGGTSVSASVPQAPSHARVSSPVKCMPVA